MFGRNNARLSSYADIAICSRAAGQLCVVAAAASMNLLRSITILSTHKSPTPPSL